MIARRSPGRRFAHSKAILTHLRKRLMFSSFSNAPSSSNHCGSAHSLPIAIDLRMSKKQLKQKLKRLKLRETVRIRLR